MPEGRIEVGKFEWLDIVASERGPPDPTTILVLLVLGLHMTQKGRCFPSQDLIAKRSHLSDRAVRKHLTRAAEGHWIGIQRKRREGQAWYVNEYVASIPQELEGMLKSKPWQDQNGERPAPRAACTDDRHHVPPVERRPAHNDRRPAPGATTTGTWCRNDRHHVPTNSSSESPMNILKERAAHAGTIEISPEERQRQAEEQASRLAEDQERQRIAKAKKDAERRRAKVLTALEKFPDYSDAQIAKVTWSSVAEVEQLRRQA